MSIQQDKEPGLLGCGIAIIILAAGKGTRMGEQPKLLLHLADGKPVLWHTTHNALNICASEVIVVTRPDLPEMADLLSELPVRCVSNPHYAEGMATSLTAGIEALESSTEAALVMLGDEPYVNPLIIEALVSAYERERKPITMPMYGNQPGPPTLFARETFPELLKLQGDTGGKQLMDRHPEWVCFVPLDEKMTPTDIDTPEDYRAIL